MLLWLLGLFWCRIGEAPTILGWEGNEELVVNFVEAEVESEVEAEVEDDAEEVVFRSRRRRRRIKNAKQKQQQQQKQKRSTKTTMRGIRIADSVTGPPERKQDRVS